jgi:hypothetical protein
MRHTGPARARIGVILAATDNYRLREELEAKRGKVFWKRLFGG